ncbi:MAG: Do family serine endopeptidase [Candidatus Edwardsbacteria bacterium]|nr:Do family serine endopeptidase [Candidatus Edwardsbacteria bacterium]
MSGRSRKFPAFEQRTVMAGIIGLIAGLILASGFNWTACSRAEISSTPALNQSVNAEYKSPFVAVAKTVGPAVVNIQSKKYIERPGYSFQGPFDDLFREFFGEVPQREPQKQKVEGQGSGFIIDKKGLILTNNHVVAGGGELTVKLSDSREFRAEVVGTDPRTDVAVIRLKDLKADLPDAEVALLGNSDDIEVGDYAIAIGNPFGLERTVTQGIISFKGRSGLPIAGGGPLYQDFIQTDASINFGNSGGPLTDIRGQVIGINTAINPAGQGIGFAIPINLAKNVADQLISGGKVVRGYLGVLPQELTADLAEGLGLKNTNGVLIARVEDGTPADKAGLKDQDVIIKFNGQETPTVAKFRQIVADAKVGAKVRVELLRDRKEKSIAVEIGEMPGEAVVQSEQDRQDKPWLGIEQVLPVNSPEARAAGVKDAEGVLIQAIRSGSAADDAGLQRGDIIKKIDGQTVRTVRDYSQALGSKRQASRPVVFLIKRGEALRFFAVRPGK